MPASRPPDAIGNGEEPSEHLDTEQISPDICGQGLPNYQITPARSGFKMDVSGRRTKKGLWHDCSNHG